jgi:hypothetical protein
MRDERSASQVQFGFLPEQTVDVKGGVWKVAYWNDTIREHAVDIKSLRAELVRAISPWTDASKDSSYAADLRANHSVELRRLNKDRGVTLKHFPGIWVCRNPSCRRIHRKKRGTCKCGATGTRAQLPFVGYHECGRIKEPPIPTCPTHSQVAIRYPGTASARDIRFECPECNRLLRSGLSNNAPCECGAGDMRYTVHRAASVYTPRSIVMVNPPATHKLEQLTAAGGAARAVEWVLDGMKERNATEVGATAESLRQQLKSAGLPEKAIEAMVAEAVRSGALRGSPVPLALPATQQETAERDAVLMAMAATESRQTIGDLQASADPISRAGVRYRAYDLALHRAKLQSVELYDEFPVMVGHYGFTRGGTGPGESVLRPFRDRNGAYSVYGEISETEALLFKLSPVSVREWLKRRKLVDGPTPEDERSARLALLQECVVPGWNTAGNDAGAALLELVHSISHRAIRLMAVHAGIERNALSELLVPNHLSFYVYAASKGDFVLGGLQAVFESDLDTFLKALVDDEHRCALDPGCERGGGACSACLHIGEPSCRWFNTHLSRHALFGSNGYLR